MTSAQAAVDEIPRRLALLGSPNSGKTTLFNHLTGLKAKVGNYPGVTVEHIEGTMRLPDGSKLTLLDLPGTYGTTPLSSEEHVTHDVLRGTMADVAAPEGVIFVADATTLRRTLPHVGTLRLTGVPMILVLTMIDEIKARGGAVDDIALSHELGIPVVGIVGNRGIGVDDLRALLGDSRGWQQRAPKHAIPEEIEARFAWGDAVHGRCVKTPTKGTPLTDAVDRVLLHPLGGVLTFLVVMVLFFQTIFSVAKPITEMLGTAIGWFGAGVGSLLPAGLLRSLVVDGAIKGVGNMLVFVPQIMLLFVLLSFLQNVGYLSRAAFVVDRFMGWFGLDGRCFVALLSSHACAIPGIMAARSVPDPKSRLATILVAPFMTCSARLPLYIVMISAFVPETSVLGPLGAQGLTMFGLFLLGGFTGLFSAAILRRSVLRGTTLPFYIELPPYRWPSWKTMVSSVWRPVWMFVRKVTTVLLLASVVLWTLMTFPRTEPPASVSSQGKQAIKAYRLQHSIAGRVGLAMEPVMRPLGFDWKLCVGILAASLAAREVIVSSLGQLYALGDVDDESTELITALQKDRYPPGTPRAGQPVYSLAVALSLMVFFAFALQCISTLAVMRKETGSWKWPVIAYVFMLALAYVGALVTFQVGKLFLS